MGCAIFLLEIIPQTRPSVIRCNDSAVVSRIKIWRTQCLSHCSFFIHKMKFPQKIITKMGD